MSINLELTGPLRVFWGWFCLIDRCLSLLFSAMVVASRPAPLIRNFRLQRHKTTLGIFFFFTTSPMSEGFVQSVWRNRWCVGAATAHMYGGLFMATAGWKTGQECQHAGQIFVRRRHSKLSLLSSTKSVKLELYSTKQWCSTGNGNSFPRAHSEPEVSGATTADNTRHLLLLLMYCSV